MSSVQQLAQGLANRCDTISGLRCYAAVPPAPQPPAMYVRGPMRWTYDDTFEGYWRPIFELWVVVNPADTFRAEQALHTYLAPTGQHSIPAAVYGDPTLGGVADTTRCLGGTAPPGMVQFDSGPLLGCAIEVEVLAM